MMRGGSVWGRGLCHEGDHCVAGQLDGAGLGDLVSIPSGIGHPLVDTCEVHTTTGGFGGKEVLARRHRCQRTQVSWVPSLGAQHAVADVDGDGQDDLVRFASGGGVDLGVLEWTGDGATLGEFSSPTVCGDPRYCHMADVNGDVRPDVVTFETGGDVGVSVMPFSDQDGDLVPDEVDNCPSVMNPDQADSNDDGLGDACTTECTDGLDNDGDGVADAADPGCSSAADLSERTPLVQCDDGADNDADGRVDYPEDPNCAGPEDNREARAGSGSRCGLGFEQILLLPVLMGLRRRRGRA
jgi:hypothetical protein